MESQKTSKSGEPSKGRDTVNVRKVASDAVAAVSRKTGLKESSVRAGLLFSAGLLLGLFLRSRR